MRFGKIFTAAFTSAALLATPVVAAPMSAASRIDAAARASADTSVEDELFRNRGNRRGGALVFILIAVVIAVGVYIVVDKDDKENPVSP